MIKAYLHWMILAAALLAIALLANAWRTARNDSTQLASALSSQKSALQHAATDERQQDAQLAAALAAIASQKRNVKTPRQAAAAIPSMLQHLPLPVSIQIPSLAPPLQPAGDNPPATVSIPQPDLKPLYDDLQDCRANALESDTLKKDLADEKASAASLAKERDAALTAVHGGTFWVRLKREAKWFAIGIATGAAATAIARR